MENTLRSNSNLCKKVKLNNFLIDHKYKKIGIILTISFFGGMIINKLSVDSIFLRDILKYLMLASLLLVSLAKEEIEDERVQNLRLNSYTFAFIVGVGYAIILPFIVFMLELLISSETPNLQQNGDFVILWMLLVFQVCYFRMLTNQKG